MVKANKLGLIEHAQKTLDKTYPAYKIQLGSDFEVVVRRPIYTKSSVAGTATRGYLGYSIQGKRLVFLKDLWDNERNEFQLTEREVYELLIPCHSPHIPKSLFVGLVSNSKGNSQITRSQALAFSVWTRREHCRVVQEVYYPISELLSSKDVVCVIRDCLLALHEAYLKAKIVHSDVSTGNVMMTSECAGILNDWGNGFEAGTKPCFRSGTWAFMSCEKARDRDLHYHPSIKDDIESMFWVLYCQMLQSFVTENTELRWHWKMFIEREVMVIDGRPRGVGGTLKYEFLTSQHRADQFRDGVTMTSPALKDLIFQFRNLLGRYYISGEKLKNPEFCQLPVDEQQEHQRNVDALKDARAVLQLFDEALLQDGWVCGDAYERKIWVEQQSHVAFVSSFGVPSGAEIYDVLYSMPDYDLVTEDKTVEPLEPDYPQIHTGKRPRSDHPKARNGSDAGSQSSVEEPLPKKAKQG
ncbi:hypothetical protein EIP86_004442 [Pleurotus ostreatoroseus]|nr:hypothetical protein EIP86_004442 [Pleurotus ostreatoroseus]